MLCPYCFRENGLIINVVVAGDLSGIGAVHLDDFREVIINGIKGEILIFTPGDSFLQGFACSAGPEDEFIARCSLNS